MCACVVVKTLSSLALDADAIVGVSLCRGTSISVPLGVTMRPPLAATLSSINRGTNFVVDVVVLVPFADFACFVVVVVVVVVVAFVVVFVVVVVVVVVVAGDGSTKSAVNSFRARFLV